MSFDMSYLSYLRNFALNYIHDIIPSMTVWDFRSSSDDIHRFLCCFSGRKLHPQIDLSFPGVHVINTLLTFPAMMMEWMIVMGLHLKWQGISSYKTVYINLVIA